MKFSHILFQSLVVSLLAVSIIFNLQLSKEIDSLRVGIMSANMMATDTSMTVESALQMLTSEGPKEVERISRKVAKEEVVKGFQKFNENFQKLSEKKDAATIKE